KSLIEIKNLEKEFGRRKVIDGIDLRIDTGDSLSILGPNGAGKTTLIKLLSTLQRPSSGTVLMDGLDIKENGRDIRKSIGVLGHDSYLYDNLSAIENLEFYARMYGVPPSRERVGELLTRVGLQHRMHDMVGTYSRGMRQRLDIIRAVIHDPKTLLLDEPFTGLDLRGCNVLRKMIREFQSQRKTVVMVTHDVARGYEVGERIIVLIRGKIVSERRKGELGLEEFTREYEAQLEVA
ncbi:MAG: ABC transporter ATP-binding protein, partial [Thermoplasmata archaeon]